jgi:ABC-type sugar transport system substrate-binding protein
MTNDRMCTRRLFVVWITAGAMTAAALAAPARADVGAQGITKRVVLPAFDRNAPTCNAPHGLTKVLAFVQENEREFLQGVNYGLAMAARDRGMEYRKSLAENDAAKAASEIDKYRAAKVGALVATSPDPAAVRASIALSSPVFGYAMGQYAADWLEGKSVPQAMDILPIALTHSNITQYEADLVDPSAVFADPARRDMYLKMFGNICYDTRDRYINFAWSSEQQ